MWPGVLSKQEVRDRLKELENFTSSAVERRGLGLVIRGQGSSAGGCVWLATSVVSVFVGGL